MLTYTIAVIVNTLHIILKKEGSKYFYANEAAKTRRIYLSY